jgi:hypothetical protein
MSSYEDVADPSPVPAKPCWGRACALNHLDHWQRRAWNRQIPLPPSPAPTSRASGFDSRRRVGVGRPVMVQPGLSCERCVALMGRQRMPKCDVLGYRSDGGYAEMVRCRCRA